MAETQRRRVTQLHNAGRKKKKNAGRRRLTAKQIKFFGSPAQKAALKRKRSASGKRAASHRKPLHRAAKKTTRRRVKQAKRNPGEIVSVALNPARQRRGKTMAKKASGSGRRSHRGRSNPSKTRARGRRGGAARRRRSNPAGGRGVSGLFTQALFIIAGAVGSKVITQAVLGDKNRGPMGYIGNGIVTLGLSLTAGKVMKNSAAANAIMAGGVVQIVLRLITDYTPFGRYTAQLGMGDYQVSNFVTPQRYTDALHSAEVEIPAGWAPRLPPPVAAPAGMGALYGGGNGGALY